MISNASLEYIRELGLRQTRGEDIRPRLPKGFIYNGNGVEKIKDYDPELVLTETKEPKYCSDPTCFCGQCF